MAKKTLYHSEFVKMGPVQVRVSSDVIPSKFAGKRPFVELTIDGEVRQYSTENDACAEVFEGKKGETLMVEALGGREDATINIIAGNSQGSAARENANARTAPKKQAAPKGAASRNAAAPKSAIPPEEEASEPEAPMPKPAPKDAVDIVTDARKFLARRGNLFRLSAQEALRQIEACAKRNGVAFGEVEKQAVVMTMMDRMAETMVTSLFISADRAGMGVTMPFGELEPLLEAAAKRQADKKKA